MYFSKASRTGRGHSGPPLISLQVWITTSKAAKFGRHPARFKRVFGNAGVQIYQVLEEP